MCTGAPGLLGGLHTAAPKRTCQTQRVDSVRRQELRRDSALVLCASKPKQRRVDVQVARQQPDGRLRLQVFLVQHAANMRAVAAAGPSGAAAVTTRPVPMLRSGRRASGIPGHTNVPCAGLGIWLGIGRASGRHAAACVTWAGRFRARARRARAVVGLRRCNKSQALQDTSRESACCYRASVLQARSFWIQAGSFWTQAESFWIHAGSACTQGFTACRAVTGEGCPPGSLQRVRDARAVGMPGPARQADSADGMRACPAPQPWLASSRIEATAPANVGSASWYGPASFYADSKSGPSVIATPAARIHTWLRCAMRTCRCGLRLRAERRDARLILEELVDGLRVGAAVTGVLFKSATRHMHARSPATEFWLGSGRVMVGPSAPHAAQKNCPRHLLQFETAWHACHTCLAHGL
eukprot:364215-Chlamydomonas_euryale.AAC.21